MAAGSYVAGAYHVGYTPPNGQEQDLGQTELGFETVIRPSFNKVMADEAGRTPLDGLWTGIEDIIIRMESIEWSANIWKAALAFLHIGSNEGTARAAGLLMSTIAGTLRLFPITGNADQQYTFTYAYPLEPVRTTFSAQRLRTTPVGWYVFADSIDENYQAVMYDAVSV